MKVQAQIKYGKEEDPWKPNLLTAFLQLVLAPFSLATMALIMGLVFVYDFLTMGSQHVVLNATPKRIQMPDGSIRETAP